MNSIEPVHLSKSVYFDSNQIVSEKDIFHYEGQGDISYKLEATSFEGKDSIRFRLIRYYRYPRNPPTDSHAIDIDSARVLLKSWGFSGVFGM